MGSEAEPLGQPERRSGPRSSTRSRRTSDAGASGRTRSDRTLKWESRGLEDLLDRIIPHFETYPLLSGKRLDFELFARVCRLQATGAHRHATGLIEIVELARGMNPSGKRRYDAEEIIAKLRQGEGIVCASGNGG